MDGVLLGGLMAGGSAALTLVLSQWFALLHTKAQRKHDLLVLRRAKLEEFGARLNDGYRDASAMGWSMSVEQLQGFSYAPNLQHAYLLTQIYFPKLMRPTEKVLHAWLEMYSSLLDTMLDGSRTASELAKAQDRERYPSAASDYLEARFALDRAIEAHAPEYVRS